jgi:hypothetical protein
VSMFKSVGPCEVCGRTRECSEVRSDILPLPRVVRAERGDADEAPEPGRC